MLNGFKSLVFLFVLFILSNLSIGFTPQQSIFSTYLNIPNCYSYPTDKTGLIAHWRFEEGSGTTAQDYSGNGHNGTLNNMEASDWVEGKFGKCLQFDGANEYVEIADTDALDLTGDYTISAWINPSGWGESNQGRIIDHGGGSGSPNSGWSFHVAGAYGVAGSEATNSFIMQSNYNVPAFDSSASDNSIELNRWQHVVATFNNGVLTFYVDGNVKGTTSSVPNVIARDDVIRIGIRTNDLNRDYSGKIDEVRIYNRAMTSTEITRIFQETRTTINASQTSKLTEGLILMQSFDGADIDLATNTTYDRSGNENNGTITNGAKTKAGKIGQALAFDGVDDYVDLLNTGGFDPSASDFTLSLWCRARSFELSNGADPVMFQQDDGGGTGRSWLFINTDASNKITAFIGNADRDSGYTPTLNDWCHVILIHNNTANTLTWYVDNVAKNTNSGVNIESADGNFLVASSKTMGDGLFNGLIDEVRMYNRILTSKEIEQLYITGKVTVGYSQIDRLTNGLVLMQSFDGGDIDLATGAAYDRSGSGNDGTLTNGPKTKAGRVGQALSFDGINDHVSVNADASMSLTQFGVSFWMNANQDSDNATVEQPIVKAVSNSTDHANYVFAWSHPSGSIQNSFHFYDGSTWEAAQIATTMDKKTWYHVVGTYDGTNLKVYLNGVLEDTELATEPITGNYDLFIGTGQGSNSPEDFFDGSVDEVRIYNRALTAEEVYELYLMGGGR